MTNPLQPPTLLDTPDFSDALDADGHTRAQLLEALLLEALANPRANRGRFSVSADELGLGYAAVAVRGDAVADGHTASACFFNPRLVDRAFDDKIILWTERDRTGEWQLVNRPWECLVEYLDTQGGYHLDHFEGNFCAALVQAIDHLQGK